MLRANPSTGSTCIAMHTTTSAIGETSPPGSKPAFQRSGAWPHIVFSVALSICILVLLMALAVVMLCLVPSISTSLPNLVMGPPSR